MTTLVAVAFPYETTASAAAEDVRRTALDIVVDAGAVAVVSCDRTGRYHATTNHAGTDGTRWGVFWILLFTALFFAPSPAPHPDGHRQPHRRWDSLAPSTICSGSTCGTCSHPGPPACSWRSS